MRESSTLENRVDVAWGDGLTEYVVGMGRDGVRR